MNTRKIIAIISVLLVFLNGCSFWPKKAIPDEPKSNYANPLKYQIEFQHHLQYQHLTEAEQHNYGLLYATIKDAIDTDAFIADEDGTDIPGVRVSFDVALNKASMSHLYEAFLNDNPQFFFLDRTYRLEGLEENGHIVYDTLLVQFTLSKRDRQNAIKVLNNTVETIMSDCPNTEDDYLIEKYFHDYLINRCCYDDEAANSDSAKYENAYSAYGALIDGRAVCEGYAKAMQLLLQRASIPATVIIGHSADDGEPHMWNLVNINDAYYHLDVTWNDSDDIPQYTYFNVTTADIRRTHLPDDNQLDSMDCTAVKDNYFVRSGTFFDTYEREIIAKAIADRITAEDTIIYLRFATGKYENALLFLKNVSLTQKMVNNQLGGRIAMWDYSLIAQPQQCVITLMRTK